MNDVEREAECWNKAGRELAASNNFDEAIEKFDRALLLCPRYVNALYNKGITLMKFLKYQDAIDCFSKALSLAPNDRGIYNKNQEAIRLLTQLESAKNRKTEPPTSKENSTVQSRLFTDEKQEETKSSTLSEGVVYLLRMGKHYKIGKTNNPAQRYSQLKIQLPEKVIVVHEIKTNNIDWLERHWHNVFGAKRTNGEWFLLDGKDVTEFLSCLRLDVEINQQSRQSRR